MTARLVATAEAVKTALNTATEGTFNSSFTATRAWIPRFELTDLTTLRVTVIQIGTIAQTIQRGKRREDFLIDVGVQRKIDVSDNSGADALFLVTQQIVDYLCGRTVNTNYTAVDPPTNVLGDDAVWLPDHMREKGVWTSAFRFTFKGNLAI